jgi:hypothetical protein
MNKAIIIFLNRYCDLFGFRNEESRDVFRGRLKLILSYVYSVEVHVQFK